MLSEKIQAALNHQIKRELDSAHLYLSMSAYCEAMNLPGFANWMRRQSQEEVSHSMKIFDYVHQQNGRVKLKSIDEPAAEFKSLLDMWQKVLDHERQVSKAIHELYELTQEESDYATQAMLQWFITEQVEEEKTASAILEQVKMIGTSSPALFFLDRHVGKEGEQG